MNNSENNNNNIPNNNQTGNVNPNNPNAQILYDQYGNPVYVNQTPQQQAVSTNPNVQAQSTKQAQPQVVKQVEKKQGPTKVVHQEPPTQKNNHSTPPPQKTTTKKKPGPFRYILLILFFILIMVLIYFLPDIRKYMTEKKAEEEEEVINGTLKCVYEEEDDLLTTLYTSEFTVVDNKLKAYTSTTETKGDTGSEEELTALNDDCELLSEMVKGISGIQNSCSLNSRKQTSIQQIDYKKVNTSKLKAAYSEAGGIVPDYKLNQNALDIKHDMTLSGYSCTVN